ncbi:hypothetical protein [Clostridioides difficile]|uniref:hypothetical protein n=1 Tax=Clostridioides difficile TaxID=1496 RepID=UPI00097FE718|nr:hypothetical protein [Clostridioides difficile]SJU34913.1 Uncharacterised protein [Clostridioides difficile]
MSLIKYRGYDFENEKWIYSETIKWSDAVDCLFMLKENCETCTLYSTSKRKRIS